jgi:hypothetical protein
MGRSFLAAADLAGYFTAHAVWSVSESNPMMPVLGHERDGQRTLVRYTGDGAKWLAENPEGVERAVLVLDGEITLAGRPTDALLVDARQYGDVVQRLVCVVPYRRHDDPAGFAVYQPRFTKLEHLDEDPPMLGEAFFRGVATHPDGSKVWSARADHSQR